jgi:hypothetical protein
VNHAGFDESLRVQAAKLAEGPPFDLPCFSVEGIRVVGRPRRVQAEGQIATVLMPVQVNDVAGWKAGQWFFTASGSVEQMKSCYAVLVARDGERLAIGGELNLGDVPRNVRCQVGRTMSGDINPCHSPELRIAVGDGVDALAILAEVGVAVSNGGCAGLRRELRFFAACDIDQPQIALAD